MPHAWTPPKGRNSYLSDNKSVLTREFQGDAVGDDGRVSVRNVRKGPSMHEHRRAFQTLHQSADIKQNTRGRYVSTGNLDKVTQTEDNCVLSERAERTA